MIKVTLLMKINLVIIISQSYKKATSSY